MNYDIGIELINYNGFDLYISSPERAILKTIFLSPNKTSLREIAQIIETMTSLRQKLLQELLEKCSSIKTKRIFLYLTEQYKHNWLNFIDQKI